MSAEPTRFLPVVTPTFGPHDPVLRSPARAPGSVRRTTSLDLSRPEGPWGVVVADVRGRDICTRDDGQAQVVDGFSVRIEIDAQTGAVVDVVETGRALRGLVGTSVRSGYSRRIAELLADERDRRTLRFSLLDDLGGGLLVSGYGPLREGAMTPTMEMAKGQADAQADICAGWATGGPVLEGLRVSGLPAVPMGPLAPSLEDGDPDGWHPMAPLPAGAVRRRRRLDLVPAGDRDAIRIDSHFRDSYAAADGEMVMHEYHVEAALDDEQRLAAVTVEPRVLPWEACPRAVASSSGVVGVAVDELPARVRAELVGVTTCTHLNSTLRCLADTVALLPHLPRP
jgi:hypothetical protein